MTDGLDQALADAGLDLLRADAQLTVYDGKVPDPTPDVATNPYVLVYTAIAWPPARGDSMDGRSVTPYVRWICHCVGASAAAARAVEQRVRTQLLNQRPVIAGLSDLGPIRWEQGDPPVRDETTSSLVMDAVVIYRLGSPA